MSGAAPLVSVVVPAFDAAPTVAATLESLLTQSVADLEVVVVDDGSTDGTGDVVRATGDPRVVVVTHPTNRGIVAAARTGIAHASAPVIARLDADDVAQPDRIARQLAVLRAQPSVGLVASGFVSVDPGGGEQVHGVPPDHAAAWFRLHFANCFAHSTTMFRRAAYDATAGFDARCAPAEDHELWLRLAEVTRLATIADPLVRYHRSPGSLTARAATAMARASRAATSDAYSRSTGSPPPAGVLDRLRPDAPPLAPAEAADALDAVLAVYRAVRRRCRTRGIPVGSLPGQLAALLAARGLRRADGRWSREVLSHAVRHPRTLAQIRRDRSGARRSGS
jgi:GT2 family glycosyltransferase